MSNLTEYLGKNRKKLIREWQERVIGAFPPDGAKFIARERDPFANPIGRAIRTGTEALFDGLVHGELTDEDIDRIVDDMIRIGAIQEHAPSRAVGFPFLLKGVVRDSVEGAAVDVAAGELKGFEDEIDRVALRAFDKYTECRDQIFSMRIKEIKRMSRPGFAPPQAQ